MSIHQVEIIDAATLAPVKAELHDDLTADVLLDIEDQWGPARHQLRKHLRAAGVPSDEWPESLHWDWGRKSLGLLLGDPDDYRIMAIQREAVWEAATVTLCKKRFSCVAPDEGRQLVYVDYLENAPWNWTVKGIQKRKFVVLGSLLLRSAIEQSYAKGWDGRLGLHALPRAERFYTDRGCKFVKNDPTKQNLPYFELSAAEALIQTGRR